MNTFSYNINKDTVCCLVCSDGQIKDISMLRSDNKTNKQLISRATKALSSLVKKYKQEPIRFRYPPIEKGDTQEQLILDSCDLSGTDFDFRKTPFSINSSIASMYREDKVGFVSFDNISEPYKLYTDASVVESRDPSISSCLLNSENEILHLVSQSIRNIENVTTGELIAGYLGLKICDRNDIEKVEWYCDNNSVLRFVDGQQEEKIQETYFSNNIRSLFGSHSEYNKNRISGNKNKLADSMAKDIRHEEVNRHLEFSSPAFQDHTGVEDTLKEITRRTGGR